MVLGGDDMAKDTNVGIKISADVVDLKSGIKEIKDEISRADKDFQKATAGLDKWSTSSEGLGAKLTKLNTKLSSQKKSVELYQAEIERVSKLEGDHSAELEALKEKLDNAEISVKKTEKQIRNYSNSLEEVVKNEKEQESALGKLTRTISEQENKLSDLQNEYKNAVLTYGKNSKEAKALKNEINDLSDELNKNKERIDDADDSLEDFQKEMKDTEKQSLSFGDVLKANLISDAIVGGVKALGSAVASVGRALKDSIVSSSAFADEMLTLSTQTGVSTDKLQEYEYMAGLIDVDVSTITGSMAKLTKNMATASKGTGASAEAFKSLGVQVTNADGTLRSNQDVFNDTITALGKIENETQRDAYAMQIFGKSAQELNPLIAQGGDALAKFSEEAHNAGYVLDEEALNSLGAVDDSMQRFGKAIEGAKNQLMVNFAPAISEMINAITPFISSITRGLTGLIKGTEGASGEVASGVKGIVNVFTTKFKDIIPKVQSIIAKIIPTIINGLISNLPTLLNNTSNFILQIITHLSAMLPQIIATITQVIPLLVTSLTENLPTIISAIVGMLPIIIQSITDLLPVIIQAIMTLIPMLIESIIGAIPLILDSAIQLLMSIVNAVPVIIEALVPMLPSIINTILTAVMNAYPQLLDGAIKLFNAIVKAIPTILKLLVKELPNIISTIVSALINGLPDILNGAIKLFSEIIKAIPEITILLIKSMPDIIKAIVKGLLDGLKDIKQVGIDLVKGLWNGIKDMTSWVTDKLKGFGDSVLGGIKKFFGIKSPSKETAKLGVFIAQGLGVGIKKGEKDVIHAGEEVGENLLNAMENSVDGVAIEPDINVGGSFWNNFISETAQALNIAKEELESFADEMKTKISAIGDGFKELGKTIFDAFNQGINNQITELDFEIQKQRELKEQGLITQEELAQAEQETIKKKNALAKKQFNAQKANDIAQATIQGALAIMKGFAELGPIAGGVNAVIQAGITATQIGTIASQKFVPMLAKGGIVNSPTLAMVGEAGKEAVMPLENNTGWIRELAEKLNEIMKKDFSFNAGQLQLNPAMAQSPVVNNYYYQTIQSPQQLSRKEIYRDTKNLLSLKGM